MKVETALLGVAESMTLVFPDVATEVRRILAEELDYAGQLQFETEGPWVDQRIRVQQLQGDILVADRVYNVGLLGPSELWLIALQGETELFRLSELGILLASRHNGGLRGWLDEHYPAAE